MIDPREIRYQITANSDQAVSEINDLIRTLGKASMDVAKLQTQINKLMRVSEASELKTVRSALGTLAGGGIDTMTANATTQAVRNRARASAASATLAQEKAIAGALRDQELLMERFTKRYDQLIALRKQLNALEADARAGNQKAIEQQKQLQAQAQATINAVTSQLPKAKQAEMRSTLERVMTEAGFNGLTIAGRNSDVAASRRVLGQRFYNTMTGRDKITAAEAKAIIERSDAAAAEIAAAGERKAAATEAAQQARDQRKRQSDIDTAQRALYKRLMQEYKRSDARAVTGQQTAADMDRVHAERMERIRGDFERQMRARFPDYTPVFDSTLFDDEHRYRKEAELERRRERDDSAARREAELENKRRDREAASADRKRMSDLRRKAAMGGAAEMQAIGGLNRSEAFGGAGLFAVQGNLLRNYAMMGATIGSIGFLGNYVIELEKSLAQLQAISTATDGEMKKLEKTIISMGRNSKFSAQELADAATIMAQAGLSVRQIEQALPAVTNLAVGTGTDLATTVDTITSTMTVFNLQTSEAVDVANTLTAAMNLSKLSIDKYALGLQYSGNIADTVGIRYNELAAVLGGMADAGVKSGSTLGTGFRQLLLDLQTPTEKAMDTFKRLGLSMSDLDIESKGLFQVLRNLKDAGFTTADATHAFEVRSVAAFKAIMNNIEGIEDLNQQMLLTSAATDAAGIQMDTLAAKGSQFASGFGGAFYAATENVRESLKGVLDLMIMLTAAMEAAAPVIQPLITLGIAFFTVWAVGKIAGVVKGLADINNAKRLQAAEAKAAAAALAAETAAQNANTGASTAATVAAVRQTMAQRSLTVATRIQTAVVGGLTTAWAALRSVQGIMTIALTAASIAFGILSENAQKATNELDAAREATNNAKADFNETKETIDALSSSIDSLVNRSETLRNNSSDMASEILLLQQRFADYGLELNATVDNIDSVIPKMIELRRTMIDLAGTQAQITLGNLGIEREAILKRGREKISQGGLWGAITGSNQSYKPIADLDTAMWRNNIAGGRNVTSVFSKYYNMKTFGDNQSFANISLEQLYQDLAAVNAVRAAIQSALDTERSKGKKADKGQIRRFEGMLEDFDTNMVLMNLFKELAVELAQNEQQMKLAEKSIKSTSLEGMAEALGIITLANQGKQTYKQGSDAIQERITNEGIDADVSAELYRALGLKVEPIANMLETAVQKLLIDLVQQGIAVNEDDAKAMLRSSSFYDAYNYTTNVASRQNKTAFTEEAPIRVQGAQQQIETASASMNRAVRQGVMGQKVMKAYPNAVTTEQLRAALEGDPELQKQLGPDLIKDLKPISLEDALNEITAATEKRVAAMREKFQYEFPGVFEDTEDGSPKLPRRRDEYIEAVAKLYEEAESARASLGRYLGLDDSGANNSERVKIDEEIKVLEAQKANLEAKMSAVMASVDNKSSPTMIDAAIATYEQYVSQWQRVADKLFELKWDDMDERGFKDPANAAALRETYLDNKSSEFEEKGNKALASLRKTRRDAADRLTMLLAQSVFEAAETRLKAMISGGGEITSDDILRERIRAGNELLDTMMEQALISFDNMPDNKERPEDPEVARNRRQVAADVNMQRASMALNYIDQRFADAQAIANRSTQAAQSNRDMLDNSTNAYSTSDIQRYMEDRKVRDAYRAELKSNVGAAQSRVNDILLQKSMAEHEILQTEEGSPEQNAAISNKALAAEQLTAAMNDLTAATAAFNAETGKASNGEFWDMATASIEQFVEQEGILMKASETIANGLGDVFRTMRDSVTDALYGIITATKDTGDAYREMGNAILKSLLDLALKVLTNYIIIQGLKLIASMLPGGGFSQGFADAFAAAGFGNVPVAGGKALGGEVTGGVPGRDSILVPMMPGEFVMRKSAVDMIGKETLRDANATGRLAQSTVLQMRETKREPDMVNVYVVSPDQKPSMGKKDIVVALIDDVRENGPVKKLIKQIAVGAA